MKNAEANTTPDSTEEKYIELQMKGYISRFELAQKLHAEGYDYTNPLALLNGMEWLEDLAIKATLAGHAKKVLYLAEKNDTTIRETYQSVCEYLKRDLLANTYRANSSSAFHNATTQARAEAAAQFINRG